MEFICCLLFPFTEFAALFIAPLQVVLHLFCSHLVAFAAHSNASFICSIINSHLLYLHHNPFTQVSTAFSIAFPAAFKAIIHGIFSCILPLFSSFQEHLQSPISQVFR
jgi:hypothetical protein